MIITGLTEYMVAVVGNTAKGTIIEVLMEVYFKVITRKSTIFIRSQIAS